MRVIESGMLRAAREGVAFKSGNTEVRPLRSGQEYKGCGVFLHGNHIAVTEYDETGEWIVVPNLTTLQAWPTATTCSRLRALGVNVNIKKGVPYVDGVMV